MNFAEWDGFRVLTIFYFDYIQVDNFPTFYPGRFQADKEMCNSERKKKEKIYTLFWSLQFACLVFYNLTAGKYLIQRVCQT